MKPVIVITRTRPDADALAARLDALGYETLIEPMLHARATHNATPYDPMCVEGLVVTSAHALRHLNALVREVALKHKPLYAVGPRTARMAQDMGWTNVHDGGGDVRRLGAFLRERPEITPSARLLHICGRDIAGGTRGTLDETPGQMWDWVVYETEPAMHFTPAFVDAARTGRLKAVLFHSARAAQTFGSCVQAYEHPEHIKGMIFLCLSHAVLESLVSTPNGGAYATNTPDEDALVTLLTSHVPPP